jgi:hypothetical protein
MGKSPAQVALNWVATQPGITSTILGASKVAQLDDNLASLDFAIPAELRARLNEVSALPRQHPYNFYDPPLQGRIANGTTVQPWKREYLYEGAVAAKAAPAF